MNTQSKDGHRLFFVIIVCNILEQKQTLKNHAEGCFKINGTQKVKTPCKKIFFMSYHKQLMAPFVIDADF